MPPRPTKTPLLSHLSQEQQALYFPAPNLPKDNADIDAQKSSIQIQDSSAPIYRRSQSCFRWLVLFLSCFALFGSYYCYDNPTALANQFQSTYHLSDTQYNLLHSVYSIPNIFLPLLGGTLVDKIGSEISLLIFLGLVTGGQALLAFAASINSFPLMLIARVIFGLGGESLCVASTALLAVYFEGTEVALAMGLNLSLGRAGSALNDYLSFKIYEVHNSIPEALWAGFALLVLCLVATIVMIVLDRLKAKQKTAQGYIVPQAHSGEVVKCADIKEFDILYWLVTVSCVVVYGCVLPWNNIGSAFMQSQYGMSAREGNNRLMLPYLISTICVPVFGYACDRIGQRAFLLVVSTLALCCTHAIFAWFPHIEPFIPLFSMGIAYSIYASAVWPAVSLVVNPSKLGTAYGFITSVQNAGLALIPIIVGQLTGIDAKEREYFYVEVLFTGLAAFGFVVGISLWIVDCLKENKLAQPSIKKDKEKQKVLLEKEFEYDDEGQDVQEIL